MQTSASSVPYPWNSLFGQINYGVLTSLFLPHLSSSLTDFLPSLNLLCHSKTDARFMQDAPKAVWSIPYVSVAFFPSLKLNFIAYRSSKVSLRPDCIFEIDQQWQSGFSRVYSNCCCSCSFEAEIIKIGQSSHKMYSNQILNFQESTTILNACTKKSGNLLNAPRRSMCLMSREFGNGHGELGPIKDSKMVLDDASLNTQLYKVKIKGKVEQSREWSSALPYTSM